MTPRSFKRLHEPGEVVDAVCRTSMMSGPPSRVLMTLHQEAGTLSRRCRRSDASLPLLELDLASPASLAYNRTHSSAVRESSQYAPNLPHACSPPSMRWTLMHSKRLYF